MTSAPSWRSSCGCTGIKRLRPPDVGVLALEYDVMELTQQSGLVFIAYSAAPGTPAADGLALLASLAATRTGALTAPDA